MKNVFVLLMVVIMLFGVAANVFAQSNSNSEETMTVKVEDLPADLREKLEAKNKIETYGAYAGLGKEVGIAVNDALAAITKNAASFAETKVGKVTMFIVAWKVVGRDLTRIVTAVFLFLFFMPIIMWSYYKTCIPRRIFMGKDKDGNKKYQIINNNAGEYSSDLSGTRGVHLAFVILLIVINMFVLFA